MDLEDIQKLCELTERCEAAEARVVKLEKENAQMKRSLNARWSDYVNGTPCASIRWCQEREQYLLYIERLKTLLKEPLKACLQYAAGEPVTAQDPWVWAEKVQQALADSPRGNNG